MSRQVISFRLSHPIPYYLQVCLSPTLSTCSGHSCLQHRQRQQRLQLLHPQQRRRQQLPPQPPLQRQLPLPLLQSLPPQPPLSQQAESQVRSLQLLPHQQQLALVQGQRTWILRRPSPACRKHSPGPCCRQMQRHLRRRQQQLASTRRRKPSPLLSARALNPQSLRQGVPLQQHQLQF